VFRPHSRAARGPLAALALLAVLLAPLAALASIDGTISATFNANDRRSIGINSNTNIPVNAQPALTFTNGTGAGQAQVLYQAGRTFSGASDSLNFGSGGGLVDSYGTAVALTAVKALYINNTGTSPITVGAGTNPITTLLNSTGTMTIPPGAYVCLATPDPAGWAVTASTACNLNFAGTSGQTYQIAVLGQ
jgi:hypothetical protein